MSKTSGKVTRIVLGEDDRDTLCDELEEIFQDLTWLVMPNNSVHLTSDCAKRALRALGRVRAILKLGS